MSSRGALTIIVIAQLLGTSLWFAGNAVIPEMQQAFGMSDSATANLTSLVQFGFKYF